MTPSEIVITTARTGRASDLVVEAYLRRDVTNPEVLNHVHIKVESDQADSVIVQIDTQRPQYAGPTFKVFRI
jgi:hypothetical protein